MEGRGCSTVLDRARKEEVPPRTILYTCVLWRRLACKRDAHLQGPLCRGQAYRSTLNHQSTTFPVQCPQAYVSLRRRYTLPLLLPWLHLLPFSLLHGQVVALLHRRHHHRRYAYQSLQLLQLSWPWHHLCREPPSRQQACASRTSCRIEVAEVTCLPLERNQRNQGVRCLQCRIISKFAYTSAKIGLSTVCSHGGASILQQWPWGAGVR